MSEKLQFKYRLDFSGLYKSITSFDPAELPGFVVLTGINGSGKSHLLEAIQAGKVVSSLASDPGSDIRLFTWSTIIPTDSGPFDETTLIVDRNNFFQQIESRRQQYLPYMQDIAVKHGVPGERCQSFLMLSQLTVDQLTHIFGDIEKASVVYDEIQRLLKQVGGYVWEAASRNLPRSDWMVALNRLASSNPESFILKNQHDFFREQGLLWGEIELFQQAFAKVFVSYKLEYRKEVLNGNEQGGDYKPSERFLNIFKTPPWIFVNEILENSGLDFRVNHPVLSDDGFYEPKLHKISKSVGDMRFQDLSSGEKILMSFALCLYNTQDSCQFKNFPKLLLLDEIDAPLHPSMTKSLIDTIQKILVEGQNIAVILTTHSPSTVALAPEESIYAMDPSGPRVTKVTKNKALSILTAGVPTLSIDYSGQRQVFVESRTDAKLLDQIYRQFRSYLNPERSLSFIEVGRINKDEIEQDAGCEQVKRFVNELYSSGNRSVLGLIDWDGRNNPEACLHVLCHKSRDGLENILLDPVLVVAAIVRMDLVYARKLGLLSDTESYANILKWGPDQWQASIQKLQDIFFSDIQEDYTSMVTVEYLSGMNLKVAKSYLTMDDHDLEDELKRVFPPMKANGRRRGDLSFYVVEHVLSDAPELMPKDLLKSLDGLINFDFSD